LLGVCTAAPYSITATLGGGAHYFTARATDANGLSATSLVSRVDVANPPTAAPAARSTGFATPIDIDLLSLVGDMETPAAQLRLAIRAANHGTTTLLPDGHTARFTPATGFAGTASFLYIVTDIGYDSRTVLNYTFQGNTGDATSRNCDGSVNIRGTGGIAYSTDAPAALAARLPQSLALIENGTNGAARLDRVLQTNQCDLRNGNWTIAGWFKRISTADIDSVLQIGFSGGWASDALSLVCPNGSSSIDLRNYGGSVQNVGLTKAGVGAGVWHHFAVVRSSGTLSLYMNGALSGSDSSISFTFNANEPVKFGGVGSNTGYLNRWFGGALADIAIFNTALTLSEIASLTTQPVAYLGGQSATNTVSITVSNSPLSPLITLNGFDASHSNLLTTVVTTNGHQYILQATSNLVPPVAWSPLLTNSGTGATLTNLIPISPGAPRKFFRYLVQ
jgi:hypothetical protein